LILQLLKQDLLQQACNVLLQYTVPLYLLILSTLILSVFSFQGVSHEVVAERRGCAPGISSWKPGLRLVRRDGNRTS